MREEDQKHDDNLSSLLHHEPKKKKDFPCNMLPHHSGHFNFNSLMVVSFDEWMKISSGFVYESN